MRRFLRHVPALLGVLLLVGAIYVVQKEFRHLKLTDIKTALAAIPYRALLVSFVWTVLSYGVLTFYDRLGTIYAGHKVSYKRVAFASFCAYALSHNLGFAAVSGAAVRYRLYSHWGLSTVQIAKVVGFCSLTFGLGGLVLGGAILFFEPRAVPFFGSLLPIWAFYTIGASMWAVVAAYVVISRFAGTLRIRGHEFNLPNWKMAIVQVALASVDVAVTAAIFYALLPNQMGLSYLRFLAVYLASYSAGLVANLPGGIGVFDAGDAHRAGAVCRSGDDPGWHPGIPAVLLHHPAVPGGQPVCRQRDPAPWRRAAENRPHSAGRPVCQPVQRA